MMDIESTIRHAEANIADIEESLGGMRASPPRSEIRSAYLRRAIHRMRFLRNCLWLLEADLTPGRRRVSKS